MPNSSDGMRRTRTAAAAAAACCLLLMPPAAGQAAPPVVTPQKPGAQVSLPIPVEAEKPAPTGVIRGRITTFPDGRPIARARVLLQRSDREYAWVAITDAEGRYEIPELEGFDRYMLSASKTGYAARMWGEQQLPAAPTPLKLADGQVLENVDVALIEHLWVAGRILDSDGTPFGGAVVSAMRAVYLGDRRELIPVAEIITDDRGEYRLFGLPPGQYYITAVDPAFLSTGDHEGPLVYAPTFYPGVVSPDGAARITLEPGAPRENIDFPLSIIKPARVRGRIASYDNQQLFSGAVVMSPYSSSQSASFTTSRVDIKPDGTYEFFNVPPGRFIIRSRGETSSEGVTLFGSFTLSVKGENVSGVDMTLLPGARVEGLVAWEGASPRPATVDEVRIRAPLTDGSMFGDALTGNITDDGAFLIRGAMIGGHLIRVENLPDPWSLKTVYYRGQDVTDIPLSFNLGDDVSSLRVVFTDKSTRLDGRLQSFEGDDFESYRVVAFPANQLYWRPASRHIKLARPDRQGRFSITGLPPAVYYLAASREVDEGDLGDPGALDRLTGGAVIVELAEGERRIQDLRVRRPETRAAARLTADR
ncbi:MAG TPA: carboxypeptidase-like regulatory domain-containing protein [Vicinamibacterales bacterium]